MSTSRGPTRRALLAAGALLPFSTSVFARAAGALSRSAGERVLVVLELVGGNDGLNTLVPFADDRYHRARPVIGLDAGRVRPLTASMGLSPALSDLEPIWDRGELALIQGVGPPESTRSHFRSREIWHTARMDDPAPNVGWLGRAASAFSSGSLPMLRVGAREASLALAGAAGEVPTLATLSDLELLEPPPGPQLDLLCGSTLGRSGSRAELARAMSEARQLSAQLSGLDEAQIRLAGTNGGLGRTLGLAARLIGARLGTRVLYVTHDGYDTHARQLASQSANHRELGQALAAFCDQLAAQGDGSRVVTLVFSEFGRRVAENAGAGTDHGAGGPVLLLGQRVAGGMLGDDPDLEGELDHDVPVTLDFRRVYADVLTWLGLDPGAVLPGHHEGLSLLAPSPRR
ncbi:MAG: hypothetical protein DRQ55_11390 [Planctomycetota bacterium]|nr:MAG: hypothetical protein DRQ55_11390 [Planctomycetota bacterium]